MAESLDHQQREPLTTGEAKTPDIGVASSTSTKSSASDTISDSCTDSFIPTQDRLRKNPFRLIHWRGAPQTFNGVSRRRPRWTQRHSNAKSRLRNRRWVSISTEDAAIPEIETYTSWKQKRL